MIPICAAGLAACGGGERQDEGEPDAEFPVEVVAAEFPARQRLSNTSELELAVRNSGDGTIPNLAVTMTTRRAVAPGGGATPADEQDPQQEVEDAGAPSPAAPGSFSVPSEQPDLAIPTQPVWILEAGYPKLAGETGAGGAETALTNTFAFGPLEPGETQDLVWRLTPVIPGVYAVGFRIEAGLGGKAVAVTDGGGVPAGELVVRIIAAPEKTRVNEAGEVVPLRPRPRAREAGEQ